jgi:hypothetical protein
MKQNKDSIIIFTIKPFIVIGFTNGVEPLYDSNFKYKRRVNFIEYEPVAK